MSSESGIEPGLVDTLLFLPTRGKQTELLRDAGLLDADGLDRLLEVADRLLNEDPGKAQRLNFAPMLPMRRRCSPPCPVRTTSAPGHIV